MGPYSRTARGSEAVRGRTGLLLLLSEAESPIACVVVGWVPRSDPRLLLRSQADDLRVMLRVTYQNKLLCIYRTPPFPRYLVMEGGRGQESDKQTSNQRDIGGTSGAGPIVMVLS